MDSARRLTELVKLIHHHNNLYHALDNPEISDIEFDALVRERNDIVREHPDLAHLLETATPIDVKLPENGLMKVKHEHQMASLENAFTQAAVNEFFGRFPTATNYTYEHKLDGLALELRYENGKAQMMVTRGDGLVGEDVTHQIGLFVGIPEVEHQGSFIVRGEGVLPNEQFERLNSLQTKKYKTARNAIAGLVRRLTLDPEHTELAHFIPYALIGEEFEELDYSVKAKQLSDWGFIKPELASLRNIQDNIRSTIYPTDGIVIKVDSHEEALKAGETNHHPKWAIAYKYPPEIKQTTLIDVIWETGRLGAITPVAVYHPINLGGTTNDRATLHNFKQFQRHQLRVGSEIEICRAGDVIPYFMGVLKEGKGALIKPPTKCPSCSEPVSFDGSDGEDIFIQCNNLTGCPAQRTRRYINFIDRDGLNIMGLGEVKVDWLVSNNVVTEYRDFFRLPELRADIPLSIIGDKSFDKLIASANKARTVEMARFIKALGLPQIGKGNAKTIAKAVQTPEALIGLLTNAEQLKQLPGIDWVTAFMVVNAMTSHSGAMKREIERVLGELEIVMDDTSNLKGEVCVTGKFKFPRNDIKAYLRSRGYEMVSGVKNKVECLICGFDASDAKIEKAEQRKITVISAGQYTFEQLKAEFEECFE